MVPGKVKWFNKTKGYGFICPEDGSEDVFIHVTILEKTGMRYLEEEQDVHFETEIKNGRLRATSIEIEGHDSMMMNDDDAADSGNEMIAPMDETPTDEIEGNETADDISEAAA